MEKNKAFRENKTRKSLPMPTPVQSNPIFQQQYIKPIMTAASRQRRGSFLYKQDSSTYVGDVISQKLPPSRNVSVISNEELIITPFAQILSKLR